jgi:O-antigen chain-terminating methyltransferase
MVERTNKDVNRYDLKSNLDFINTHWDIQSTPSIIKNEIASEQGLLFKFQKLFNNRFFFHFNTIVDQQAVFNSFISQTLTQFNEQMVQNNENLSREIKNLSAKICTIENELIEKNSQLSLGIQSLDEKLTSVTTKLNEDFPSFKEKYSEAITELQHRMQGIETTEQANLDNLCQRMREIDAQINNLLQNINEIDSSLKPRISTNLSGRPIPVKEGFNYFEFEETFRGSEDLIKERQRQYIPYFKGKEKVIDLGSGRGEFLVLLNEEGIQGTGVDCDQDMVLRSREKGLIVIQQDILEYLENVPDKSLDGIFSAQVIEHLPFEKLDLLFKRSYSKLKDDGILIVETVNPHNLSAFRCFYLDPSHQKPLFPELISYMCRASGFNEIEVKYILPDQKARQANVTDPDNQWVCGDYAIIAKKAESHK